MQFTKTQHTWETFQASMCPMCRSSRPLLHRIYNKTSNIDDSYHLLKRKGCDLSIILHSQIQRSQTFQSLFSLVSCFEANCVMTVSRKQNKHCTPGHFHFFQPSSLHLKRSRLNKKKKTSQCDPLKQMCTPCWVV